MAVQQVKECKLAYAPTLFIIWMLMIASLRLYRIDRDVHEENLRTLADRA
jgi:hypothetical protein